jgi:pyridoxal 5-phosphate dependent beta-lyase
VLNPLDWVDARQPCELVHLDVAACGRTSVGVLEAQVDHLRAEAARGGYVAEGEAFVHLDAGRDALGRLVGLTGAGVAFSDSACTSFAMLLAAWPLGRGSRVGTAASEYAGNALVLRALAQERGWRLVPLPVDDDGRVTDLPPALDLVTFPHIASQRGTVQPVSEVAGSGVPLVLDVAQSLGQVEVPVGCAAYVGTSRKWLCGPRGVGFLAVDPLVEPYLATPPQLTSYTDVRRLDTPEAHVAGRAGLAQAVAEWTPEVLPAVLDRARYARRELARTPWTVREAESEPSGITTLVGRDPFVARAALLEQGILVSAVPVSRAADLSAPVLRVSTAPWVTEPDLDRLADALVSLG